MSLKTKQHPISVEEYLEGEQHSDAKHEYIDGQVYAMVGASIRHNLIAGALHTALRSHLAGGPCRAFISDVKVRVDDIFYYPDLVVACGDIDTTAYYLTHPTVIVEVLSPSTEAKDRFEKRLACQRLASLREYVLVAQDKIQVEIYRRTLDGWELEQFDERDALRFESLDFAIPVTDIYRDVMSL